MTTDILMLCAWVVGIPLGLLVAVGSYCVHEMWRTRLPRRQQAVSDAAFAIAREFLDRWASGWETGECWLWRVWLAQWMEHRAHRLQDEIEEALKTTPIATMDEHAEGWRTGDATVRRVRRAARVGHREQRQRTWMLEVTA